MTTTISELEKAGFDLVLRPHLLAYREPDPERERVAALALARAEDLAGKGWRMRPWRPGPGSPAAVCISEEGVRFWTWDTAGWWLDHPYKLLGPDGRRVYVAEPYELSGDDVAALGRLVAEGWDVQCSAQWALWYPGSTVAVWIERRADWAQ